MTYCWWFRTPAPPGTYKNTVNNGRFTISTGDRKKLSEASTVWVKLVNHFCVEPPCNITLTGLFDFGQQIQQGGLAWLELGMTRSNTPVFWYRWSTWKTTTAMDKIKPNTKFIVTSLWYLSFLQIQVYVVCGGSFFFVFRDFWIWKIYYNWASGVSPFETIRSSTWLLPPTQDASGKFEGVVVGDSLL